MIETRFSYKGNEYKLEYNLRKELSADLKGLTIKYYPIAHTIYIQTQPINFYDFSRTKEEEWEEVDFTPELIHEARKAVYNQLLPLLESDDKIFVSK